MYYFKKINLTSGRSAELKSIRKVCKYTEHRVKLLKNDSSKFCTSAASDYACVVATTSLKPCLLKDFKRITER